MMKTHQNENMQEAQKEDANQQYQKERYAAHIANRHNLDDLAFRTSERYDQWVLTLAGGALAISLTFLEKIAPEPVHGSWILLGASWFLFIAAVLAGFFAIFFSRKAICRQIEIIDEEYQVFRDTNTKEKPGGDTPPIRINEFVRKVECLNTTSSLSLCLGALLICVFALVNLGGAKPSKESDQGKQIVVNVNVPQIPYSITNTTKGK